ncbi:hypothetical protein [Mycolicibacterium vanbaalenii]|nr:hypothetical protein [Mycolicibacterium vanbaalenii]
MLIAGGIVLALNYWKWGQKWFAAAAVVGGLLTTVILGRLAWVVPAGVPPVVFLVPQVMFGYFAARWLQGRRFDAHRAAGGTRVSPGIDALIGLGITTLLVGVSLVMLFVSGLNPKALVDFQDSVDFGQGQQVYYAQGATRDDAQRFGEVLVNAGYFDNSGPAEVLIAGRGRDRAFSFVDAGGAWDDPANVEYMRDLAEYIAPDIGGPPVTVVLLDENLDEQIRCILADNWHCSP